MIEKPEGEDKQCDDEDGKRDDSEKVIRADKKIVGEKLPPGWEKHEGWLPEKKIDPRWGGHGPLNFYVHDVFP